MRRIANNGGFRPKIRHGAQSFAPPRPTLSTRWLVGQSKAIAISARRASIIMTRCNLAPCSMALAIIIRCIFRSSPLGFPLS